MSKLSFLAAFGLGLLSVAWVGAGFVGSGSWPALGMTLAIGAVFLLGAAELRRYRAASDGLAGALGGLQEAPARLDDWLERVPAGLRQAVRLRVEGERGSLPGPSLTPYLVGLLVMLGMLGTFLGMVVTFKGAVFALEASTDLQAVRAALAAPIKGLGLAFGTSVAGVATSAMLGLMSTLARRERLALARQLDACLGGALRAFTPAHQRAQSLRALQDQAQALPAVAERLDALMARMEQRGQQLDEQLLDRQSRFQREAAQAYEALARDVGTALQDSLAAGARAAGEAIQPVVERTLSQVAQQSRELHERLDATARAQVDQLSQQFSATAKEASAGWNAALQETRQLHERLDATARAQVEQLSQQFGATAREVAQGWDAALQGHARTSEAVTTQLQQALAAFTGGFEQRGVALVAAVQERLAAAHATQAEAEQQRMETWTEALRGMAEQLHGRWQHAGDAALAQWQRVGEQTLAQQQAVCEALERSAGQVAERVGAEAGRSLGEATQLLARSEALVRARLDTESQWLAQHGQRMDQLAALWRTQLEALRQDEAARGQAAVDRLGALEAEVGRHLATLGAALEAPLTRLLHTAAEVPQAAAGVISQLREEMNRMALRDNATLEERAGLLQQLDHLLKAVNQASGEQRAAVDALVASAATVMDQAGERFAQALQAQSGQAGELVASAAGAMERAGERFTEALQAQAERTGTLVASTATALEQAGERFGAALQAQADRSGALATDTAAALAQAGERLTTVLQAQADRTGALADAAATTLEQAGEHFTAALQAQAGRTGELADATAATLAQAGEQFTQALQAQAGQAGEVLAQVGASALELASLAEAFAQGVQGFQASNDKLLEGLGRIEASLAQVTTRSDEQLAYYVAQAREVIDLSIASQQGVVENLRQLHERAEALAAEDRG